MYDVGKEALPSPILTLLLLILLHVTTTMMMMMMTVVMCKCCTVSAAQNVTGNCNFSLYCTTANKRRKWWKKNL